MPQFTFNPFDPVERQQVRAMLDALDREAAAPPAAPPALAAQAADDRVIRKLPKLLRLGSGELLILAVQHFGPNVRWDVKQLAAAAGKDVETILSRNRTLAHSCKKRGIQKSALLEEHGGSPRQFSVPSAIHAEVARLLAQQAQQQAVANGQHAAPAQQ